MTVYHGSRNGKPFSLSASSNFGGGLFCAKSAIYARDYTPLPRNWEHVYTVTIPESARIFRPADADQVAQLAAWLDAHYPGEFNAADLAVDDLQTNSPYDTCEAQEGLEALGYDVVDVIGEVLVLDPLMLGVTVERYSA